MKNLISKTSMLIAAGLMLATVAKAGSTVMRVDIPFKFVVAEKTLPAGTYLVKGDTESRVFELFGKHERIALLPLAYSAFRSEADCRNGMLVFRSYGTVNVLHKIWSPGEVRGQQLPPSRIEKELARSGQPVLFQTASIPAVSR